MHTAAQIYHPTTDGKQNTIQSGIEGLFTRLGLASADKVDLVTEIRQGFSVSVIDKLVGELDIPQQTLLQTITLSSATLTRRRAQKQQRLTPLESDRVYRVATAYRAALELFEGDRKAARSWLNEPSKALGGNSPLQHLDTEAGADEVQDLIGRLEHGVIS
jgi:putative toxin-antitoxin system antitoxin component (TIGR02293 family)